MIDQRVLDDLPAVNPIPEQEDCKGPCCISSTTNLQSSTTAPEQSTISISPLINGILQLDNLQISNPNESSSAQSPLGTAEFHRINVPPSSIDSILLSHDINYNQPVSRILSSPIFDSESESYEAQVGPFSMIEHWLFSCSLH